MTAAASRCAVLWRMSGSASGLRSVTMRTVGVVLERRRQIDQLAVDDAGERRLGEAGRDRFRHVADGVPAGTRGSIHPEA